MGGLQEGMAHEAQGVVAVIVAEDEHHVAVRRVGLGRAGREERGRREAHRESEHEARAAARRFSRGR